MTPEFLSAWAIPAGLSLLPPEHNTPAARRLLIAIALQESMAKVRAQFGGGPARSFWQFEPIGVDGVLSHKKAGILLTNAALFMGIQPVSKTIYEAIEHNDVLAATCARLLLWTHPDKLPEAQNEAWRYYLDCWRPGKPRPEKWAANWAKALELVP